MPQAGETKPPRVDLDQRMRHGAEYHQLRKVLIEQMPSLRATQMKPAWKRHLLVFAAAMFLANNTAIAARACMQELGSQKHTAVQVFDTTDHEHLCPEADSATNRLPHCAQGHKNDEQQFSFDTTTVAVAPLSSHRFWFPGGPRPLALSLAPSVVGPPLTILFRNLRI